MSSADRAPTHASLIPSDEVLRCQSVSDILDLCMSRGRKKPLSMRALSSKLGLKSDRTLGMARSGQRSLTPSLLKKICVFMKVSSLEAKYLGLVVDRTRAETDDERAAVDARMSLIQSRTARRVLNVEEMRIFSSWYAFTVFRAIELLGPRVSIYDISSRLMGRVPMQDLESFVESLVSFGFLARVGDGAFELVEKDISFVSTIDISSEFIRKLHLDILAFAGEALVTQAVEEREFLSKTLVLPVGKIGEFKKRVREAIETLSDELCDEAAVDGDFEIFHLNGQFYRTCKGLRKNIIK